MGNTTSNGQGDGESRAQEPAKTCYYELLAVEKSSSAEEIKKGYKKKALELHPDRNYNDVERATKLFAEVQAAYEVLSDPQERAWYDSHREAILRGDDGRSGGPESQYSTTTTTAEEVNLWCSSFPNKSKIDYSDGPNGFYATLRQTFDKLVREEHDACEQEDLDAPYFPGFGNPRSGYDDYVKEFYAHWTAFRTSKTFSWVDRYRLSDAPDRRIRRAMEKENKRFRDDAIREFNDAVRQFVLFVRKRDPRYTPPHAGMTEAQRQAAILKTSKEQAAKARAENAAQRNGYKAASWMETAEPATVQMSEEEGESEEEVVIHECVACKKTFKTEAQYAAHERSKKHKQAVYQLKKKMEKEDRELGLEREGKETGEMEVAESESADEAAPDAEAVSDRLEDSELETVEPTSAERLSTSAIETTPVTVSDDDEDSEDINDDHVSISEFQSRVLGKDKDEELIAGMDKATLNGSEGEEDSTPPTPSGPKMGKAKLKREKKKAAAASTAAVLEHKCISCQQSFSSKQNVFNHLKEYPSHAAPVPQKVSGEGKKKKGKK